MLLFTVLLSNLAPILIMPLFNKYVPLGDEHKELADRLLELARRANTKVKGVFKFDMSKRTKAANAALTGIGNTRRIVLGDTLINEFSTDEIETVLAHELGHHVHRDIPFLITFGTLSTTLSLYLASLALNWAIGYFGFTGPADVAAFPALGLIFGAYGLITMPIENAVSRWRERMADDYALQATGKKEAFASAFTRLANQNLGEVDPEKWVVFMFYSHPPLGERIAKANAWKGNLKAYTRPTGCSCGSIQDFLRSRMGIMMINAMIKSHDDDSIGGADLGKILVVVELWSVEGKMLQQPRFPCMAGGAEYVNAALNSARTNPSPMVMMGRISFFISFFAACLINQ